MKLQDELDFPTFRFLQENLGPARKLLQKRKSRDIEKQKHKRKMVQKSRKRNRG